MKKINLILLAAVAVALLASGLTYRGLSSRADRFERGQRFLPNLNPDEVASIVLEKGEESVTLERRGDGFTVREAEGYPAEVGSVNRLLRDVVDLGLEREVGEGAGLAEELGIEPPGEETVEIRLANAAGAEMVRFRIGHAHADGGRYVQRLDGDGAPIYLTSESAFISTGADDYLDREVVNVAQAEVRAVRGPDFVLAEGEDGTFALEGAEAGQLDTAAVGRAKGVLSYLNFERVLVADAPEVRGLAFEDGLEVTLRDDSGYRVALAERDGKHYLRISGFASIDRVEFTEESSEEELQEKADLLTRADEIRDFNQFHGSWVYEVSSTVAEKLGMRSADLLS